MGGRILSSTGLGFGTLSLFGRAQFITIPAMDLIGSNHPQVLCLGTPTDEIHLQVLMVAEPSQRLLIIMATRQKVPPLVCSGSLQTLVLFARFSGKAIPSLQCWWRGDICNRKLLAIVTASFFLVCSGGPAFWKGNFSRLGAEQK